LTSVLFQISGCRSFPFTGGKFDLPVNGQFANTIQVIAARLRTQFMIEMRRNYPQVKLPTFFQIVDRKQQANGIRTPRNCHDDGFSAERQS
jgi:hypothetical protein